MRSTHLFLFLFTLSSLAFSGEQSMPNSELPSTVRRFFTAIKTDDLNMFEGILDDALVIDDWGTIFKGKDKAIEFSKGHLLNQSAEFDITEVKTESNQVIIDGTWKSKNFTGPTRFIFQLQNEKIYNLVISSPRWIDRAFISIKSLFKK